MFRNLAANLITHERIITTDAKAKELRRVTDRLITKAKRIGDAAYTPQAKLNDADKAKRLHVSRELAKFLPRFGVDADQNKKALIEKVLIELSKRFADRPGGYTRITKLGPRRGDGASMSLIEFVDVVTEDLAEAAEEAPVVEDAADDAEEADAEEADAEEESDADDSDAEDEGETDG